MKRWVSLALFAQVALSASSAGAQTTGRLGNYPEQPSAEPFSETVFGVAIDDPYRWMEKPERRDEMKRWVEASGRHTARELAALPGYAPLLAGLTEASKAGDRFLNVTVAGPRVFYMKLSATAQVPALWLREGGKDRLLLDPAAGGDGAAPRSMGGYSVAPGGRLVAVNLTSGGSEVGTVHFFDVMTGREVGETLPRVWGEAAAQWVDDATLLYLRLREAVPGEDQLQRETMVLHRIGTPAASDVPLLGTDVPGAVKVAPREVPFVMTAPGSRHVVAVMGGAQRSVRVAVGTVAAMRAGVPDWREVATLDAKVLRETPALVGDTLYYVTTKADPNGEMRHLALGPGATLADSRRLLGGKGVIGASLFTRDGGYAFVSTPYAASRLWYAPVGGTPREVPLPFVGSAFFFNTSVDKATATFAFDGFQRSTANFRLDRGRLTSLGLDTPMLPAARTIRVAEEWATSADGTKVPLTITYQDGRKGPQPTILEAYGSYGVSMEPQYSPSFTIWTVRGGVFAQCHTRGGGELGSAWHEGGRERNKPNAHADLIACGRRLVELGYATPRTLGLFGSSAGGLLVPIAAMMAPDLFAAAVVRVGVVNPTRLAVANNGANQFEEMGDPGTERGFKALAAQDATLFLPRAAGGPDFLLPIGLNDSRVDPWMSAKLVAMMRARWGDRHLALIRSDEQAGHGLNSTKAQVVNERADIFAFFLNRFGAPDFGK